jgi:hypothetical protein
MEWAWFDKSIYVLYVGNGGLNREGACVVANHATSAIRAGQTHVPRLHIQKDALGIIRLG